MKKSLLTFAALAVVATNLWADCGLAYKKEILKKSLPEELYVEDILTTAISSTMVYAVSGGGALSTTVGTGAVVALQNARDVKSLKKALAVIDSSAVGSGVALSVMTEEINLKTGVEIDEAAVANIVNEANLDNTLCQKDAPFDYDELLTLIAVRI